MKTNTQKTQTRRFIKQVAKMWSITDKLTLIMSIMTFLTDVAGYSTISIVITFIFMYIAFLKLLNKGEVISFGLVVTGLGISNAGVNDTIFHIFFYYGILMSIISLVIMHRQKVTLSIIDISLTGIIILFTVLSDYGIIEYILIILMLICFITSLWYQLVKTKNHNFDTPNNLFGIVTLIIIKIVLKK